MEIFDRVLELINANLIYCIPTMILTLLLFQVFFKEKFQFKNAFRIIKWIIIIYGIIIFPDKSEFLNRATGKYWPNYWLMMFSAIFLPFTLFYKRIGIKPFYLLSITLMMKIGWHFHFYVVLLASYHSWIETDWLNSPWSGFYMTWIQGFILALILMGLIKITEKKKTVHNLRSSLLKTKNGTI